MANENMLKIAMSAAAEFILETIRDNCLPYLHGPSGVGKTQLFEQAGRAEAALLGLNFWMTGMPRLDTPWQENFALVILPAQSMDMLDVKGGGSIDKDGEEWTTRYARPDLLPSRSDGAVIWMLIDEISQTLPSTANALRPLILEGATANYILPEGTKIMATGNRACDNASTSVLGAHVYQAFDHAEIIPDKEAFIHWLINKHGGGDGFIPAFLRFSKDEVFFNYDKKKNGIVFSTSRKLEQVHILRNKRPDSDLRDMMIAAKVGTDVHASMVAYEGMKDALVSFSSIVNEPTAAKVPDASLGNGSLAAVYAVISMCAARITLENCEAVCCFIGRLDRGFGSTFIGDVLANDKTKIVAETAAFSALRQSLDGMIQ